MNASKKRTNFIPINRLKFEVTFFLEPNAEMSQYSQKTTQQMMMTLLNGNILLV